MHQPASHQRRCRRLLVSLVLVAGCGTPVGSTTVADSGLPTLPPVEERAPEGLFDDAGCLRVGADRVDCTVRGADLDDALTDGPWRSLAGFTGERWTTDLSAGRIVVLDDSVTFATTGPWSATGLIRNERASDLHRASIRATLLDVAGHELGVVTGAIGVSPVRPGEPAPFAVSADVDAASVGRVVWSIAEGAPDDRAPDDSARDLDLAVHWQRAVSDPRPLDMYLYADEPGRHPHVLFGTATNVGDTALDEVTVTVAWIGADGRVVHVASSVAARPGEGADLATAGSALEASPAAPGDPMDFLVVATGSGADALGSAAVYVWAAAP